MHLRSAIFQVSQPNTNQAAGMRRSRGGPRDISVFRSLEPPDTPSRTVHAQWYRYPTVHVVLYAMMTLKGLRRFLISADVTHYFYKVSLTFQKLKKIFISIHDLFFHFINIVQQDDEVEISLPRDFDAITVDDRRRRRGLENGIVFVYLTQ